MAERALVPGLEKVELTESFVLMVVATPGALTFSFEAYLHRDHPLWHEPRPGEAATWVPAVMSFDAVRRLRWVDGHHPPARSADGTIDYDDIYAILRDGDTWTVDCGAGLFTVTSEPPSVRLRPQREVVTSPRSPELTGTRGVEVELDELVLEETRLRHVMATPGSVVLLVETVLVADGCLRSGTVQLDRVSVLDWSRQPATSDDPDVATDDDHIDALTVDGDDYVVECGAGRLEITATSVRVELDEPL